MIASPWLCTEIAVMVAGSPGLSIPDGVLRDRLREKALAAGLQKPPGRIHSRDAAQGSATDPEGIRLLSVRDEGNP